MNLSSKEKKFYNTVLSKLKADSQALNVKNCLKLIERGVDDPEICNKIKNRLFGKSPSKILEEQEFFQMLKLIAAVQNGRDIDEVNVETLPELDVPKLPKKSDKKSTTTSATPKSSLGATFSATTTGTEDPTMKASQPIANGSGDKENKTNSQNLLNMTEADSTIYKSFTKEETKYEEPLLKEEVKSLEEVKYEELFPLPTEVKSEKPVKKDGARQEKSPEKEIIKHEEPKEKEKIENPIPKRMLDVLDDDLITPPEKEKVKHEEPKGKGKEKVENPIPKRMLEVLDDDLITPGKIEKVDIPDFTASVKISNPKKITNPFKGNQMNNILDEDEDRILTEDIVGKADLRFNQAEDIKPITEDNDGDDYEKMLATKKTRAPRLGRVESSVKYIDIITKAQKIKVDIVDTIAHNAGYFGYGAYVTYRIKSSFSSTEEYEADRRFSEFDCLNNYFRSQSKYKGLVFPKLPEKKSVGVNESAFILQRKGELEAYLRELGRHPILSTDEILRAFLGDETNQSFQSIKDSRGVGSVLGELDWQKMMEKYEYVKASVTLKFVKEEANFDWKGLNEKLHEVTEVDNEINKLLKTITKNEEIKHLRETISEEMNVISNKIMNRVNEEKYYGLGALSSIFMGEIGRGIKELSAKADFEKEIKSLKARINGIEGSYGQLIGLLQEIQTHQELLKNKYGKTFQYQAEGDQRRMDMTNKDLNDLNGKIAALYREAEATRDNICYEAHNFLEYFEMILPVITSEYDIKYTECLEKNLRAFPNRSKI